MLLKTNEERVDILTDPTMSMKTKGLFDYSHDVYENKWTYLKP